MDLGPLIIELSKSWAWPLTLIAVAVLFQKPLSAVLGTLRDLFTRLQSAKYGKGAAEFSPAQISVESAKGEKGFATAGDEPPPITHLAEEYTPAMEKWEDQIRSALDRNASVSGLSPTDFLVRKLAEESGAVLFERIDRLIFGSQIMSLMKLRDSEDNVTIEQMKSFYDIAKISYPNPYNNYTFSQWFGFLNTHSLVTLSNDKVLLTVEGRAFLKFQVDRGYQLNKLY